MNSSNIIYSSFKFVLVLMILLYSTMVKADYNSDIKIKSYPFIVSASEVYDAQKRIGIINESGDSTEFDIAYFMFADRLCPTCICLSLPYPNDRDPSLRVKQLKNDIGSDSIYYIINVLLAKDFSSRKPYFGIDLIKKLNITDSTKLTRSLKSAFATTDWNDCISLSRKNLNILSQNNFQDSVLESYRVIKEKKEIESITPLKFSTANIKLNVMYRGVWTPLHVAVPNVPIENTFIKVPNAIVKGKWGKYKIWPEGINKTCHVEVYTNQNLDTILLGKHEYRIKNIPAPTAYFMGAKDEATFSINKLASGRWVTAKLPDFLYDLRFKVISFSCNIYQKTESKTFNIVGNKLNEEIRLEIKKLVSGDKIVFDNIIATNSIKQEYKVGPITITVR